MIVPDGLEYLPYQRDGILAASKLKDVLIGDEPGLGKTCQSIGVVNLDPMAKKILVICPAFLKPHWKKEFLRWDIKNLTVEIVNGKKQTFPITDVVIINYEILKAYRSDLRSQPWQFIIVDEIHKLKSGKADRTREVFGGIKRGADKKIIERVSSIPALRRIFLTGTPSLNGKPKELWPILKEIDPQGLGSDWFAFAKRYCQLFEIKRYNPIIKQEERVGWKWDGRENLEELQQIMRSRFMIRRTKAEVMKELPAKRRMVIPIEASGKIKKLIKEELELYEDYVKNHKNDDQIVIPAFSDIAKKMQEIGLALVPATIEIVESDLEEQDKIVVACYHQEVAEQIANHFGPATILIHGGIQASGRQALVDRFQTDAAIKVAVGTIGAMGTGFTMTAAYTMIFPERSWVPGEITQMEDRQHRISQRNQVLIKHLVLEGSLAERQVKVLIEKQEAADKMLDKPLDSVSI